MKRLSIREDGDVSVKPCVVAAFVLISLTGCAPDDFSDLNEYIEEVKARPKGTIPPLPEIKVVESFIFKLEGLRDPFNPIERDNGAENSGFTNTGGIKPDLTRQKEELELYSLDTLRMVGTLAMKADLWGLVRTKDGTIHRIRVGNYMGKNYGKIIRITEDKIELMEIVPDQQLGTWREQQASLALTE
jgi:type IV pilus assembly protein PilP